MNVAQLQVNDMPMRWVLLPAEPDDTIPDGYQPALVLGKDFHANIFRLGVTFARPEYGHAFIDRIINAVPIHVPGVSTQVGNDAVMGAE